MSRGLQAEDPGPERMTPDPERSSAPRSNEAAPSAERGAAEAGATLSYRVNLPMFEGPLDLLLHLVQKHELDILNIPIAFITEKYVEYIRLLDELNIDLASEYLVMAAPLENIATFKLLDAFQSVLERTQHTREHEIDFERFSLSEKISELSDLLRQGGRLVFHEIFGERSSRAELIITFLALLEMTRLRLTRLTQDGPLQPIYIELTVVDEEGVTTATADAGPHDPPTGEPGLPDRGDSEEYE
jgi:chromatin segregation and condensation protein Rec8/ScpA/Scc1 (kleisin family)